MKCVSVRWLCVVLVSWVGVATAFAQGPQPGAPKNNGNKPFQFKDSPRTDAPRPGGIGEPGAKASPNGKTTRPPAPRPNPSPEQPLEERPNTKAPAKRPPSDPQGSQPSGPQQPGPQSAKRPAPPRPNDIIPCPWKTPLTPEALAELDDLLARWEERSAGIERYRCRFTRWEYDPVFGPADPNTAKTVAQGDLKYAAPDKGLFKIDSATIKVHTLPLGEDRKPIPGAKPTYEGSDALFGEHWVCDGKSVFSFDYKLKVLKKYPLPPENQGKGIVDGPLPFLFGAKAETLKKRYWLRVVTPSDVADQHWIEAWPKYVGDRNNFLKVTVLLSSTDFLPNALEVCDPSFRPKVKEIRTVYQFDKRDINWKVSALSMLNPFFKEFHEPTPPFGWKLVIEDFAPPDAETVQRPEKPTEKAPPKKKG